MGHNNALDAIVALSRGLLCKPRDNPSAALRAAANASAQRYRASCRFYDEPRFPKATDRSRKLMQVFGTPGKADRAPALAASASDIRVGASGSGTLSTIFASLKSTRYNQSVERAAGNYTCPGEHLVIR